MRIKKIAIRLRAILILKLLILIFIGSVFITKNLLDYKIPYVTGDGFEYISTTEAFLNHGTPDVRIGDVVSLKKKCMNMSGGWQNFPKGYYLDNFIEDLQNTKPTYKACLGEYFANKLGKWYSFHFWCYSLINIPVYAIMSNSDPITPFYITNTLLVLIATFIFLFNSSFNTLIKITGALCFSFSSIYWYINWTHPEVFTMCFVFMGLTIYLNNKQFLGLLLLSIGCTQNQPLSLLIFLLAANTIFTHKITMLHVLKTGLACVPVILPPIFYYLNFESTNLIKDAGFLDTIYITPNRVTGFYFDVNQGVILAIPIILIVYIILNLNQYKNLVLKKIKPNYTLLIPFVLIAITCVLSTMGNWNHGQAIINRYATWMSVIIMIYCFYFTRNFSMTKNIILYSLFLVSQISTVLYYQQFNVLDWSSGSNRPLAKYIYKTWPNLYSPDPIIFIIRNTNDWSFSKENSPCTFIYKKQLKKMLVHKDKIDNLLELGYNWQTIKEIKQHITYNYGWGYVDVQKYKSTLSDSLLYRKLKAVKIKNNMSKILASYEKHELVKKLASDWNKTFEEMLYLNAEYNVDMEEAELNK